MKKLMLLGGFGANKTIGTLVLRFDSHAEAEHALNTVNDWLKVNLT